MLPALLRTWRASRLRRGGNSAIIESLRYSTSSESSSSRQNKEQKKSPSPAAVSTSTPPTEPAPEECCGKGCEECVWTVYWNDLREYHISVAEAQGIERPLDPFEIFEQRLAEKERKKKKKCD